MTEVSSLEAKNLDSRDEASRLALRRLVLAKQLFQHALDHSHAADAFNKMIAIHNMHNAVEVVLRAIMLHYDIRNEKKLNITFEAMLSEISRHPQFQQSNQRLQYRRQMLNLNDVRNLVEHHAYEPPDANVEEARVFVRRFLESAFETYFSVDFAAISPASLIDDRDLKSLLSLSSEAVAAHNLRKGLVVTAAAFHWASRSILEALPRNNSYQSPFGYRSPFGFSSLKEIQEGLSTAFGEVYRALDQGDVQYRHRNAFAGFGSREERQIANAFDRFNREIDEALSSATADAVYYAALFSSGVTPSDYSRYTGATPRVRFYRQVSVVWGSAEPSIEDAEWVHNFAVTTILRWQSQGLKPRVPDGDREFVRMLMDWDDSVETQ